MHPKQEFPKWKYHHEKPALIVPSKEAEDALGEHWVDSPADVKKPETKEDQKQVEPVKIRRGKA